MEYLKIYNILDSTNKEAHRLLAAGPVADGLTLIANIQTDGRGQLGRIWVTEPGSHLAMTIIYQPQQLSVTDLPLLGMKTSLGIINALKVIEPTLTPLIKWPNDIYFGDKKLCGILIENSISGTRLQHSIIGIGMNINENQFPEELSMAVSLHQLTGLSHDIPKIARIVRANILNVLNDFTSQWKNEYDQFLFGKDKRFSFEIKDTTMEGIVKGVSLEGKIELQLEDGTLRSFATHELKWVM